MSDTVMALNDASGVSSKYSWMNSLNKQCPANQFADHSLLSKIGKCLFTFDMSLYIVLRRKKVSIFWHREEY